MEKQPSEKYRKRKIKVKWENKILCPLNVGRKMKCWKRRSSVNQKEMDVKGRAKKCYRCNLPLFWGPFSFLWVGDLSAGSCGRKWPERRRFPQTPDLARPQPRGAPWSAWPWAPAKAILPCLCTNHTHSLSPHL